MKTEAFISAILAACAVTCASPIGTLFWEQEIRNAAETRTSFYREIGIESNKIDYQNFARGTRLASYDTARVQDGAATQVWYQFAKGLSNAYSAPSLADTLFSHALLAASPDPGMTWILYNEFTRAGQPEWASRSLDTLQSLMHAYGARCAPVIADQLLLDARSEKRNGTPKEALQLVSQSSRFDSQPVRQAFLKGWWNLSRSPGSFFANMLDVFGTISNSWYLQARFLYWLHFWIRAAIAAAMIAIVVPLLMRHGFASSHALAERLPGTVSPRMRHIFVALAFVPLLIFGVLPGLLAMVLLLIPHTSKKRRPALYFCLCVIALAPFDARISTALEKANAPASTFGVYHRVSREGYSRRLEARAADLLEGARKDWFHDLSMGLIVMKRGDFEAALNHLQRAESQAPEDPVVLLASGDIHRHLNDRSKASAYYHSCGEKYPAFARKHIEGTPRTETMQPLTFRLFSDSAQGISSGAEHDLLPIPDYPSGYFWATIFPPRSGTWAESELLWGGSFLGLPSYWVWISLGLGLVILAALKFFPQAIRFLPDRIFVCRLCGIAVCKNCDNHGLCSQCYHLTERVSNKAVKAQIENQLLDMTQSRNTVIGESLNIIFPGTGILFQGKTWRGNVWYLIAISSAIYATYILSIAPPLTRLPWVAQSPMFVILFLCVAVHVGLALKAVRSLAGSMLSKEQWSVA